jgi:hypothetical protein
MHSRDPQPRLGVSLQAGEKQQNEEKTFLQGLKPVESTQFMSALKHRLPEEKDSS